MSLVELGVTVARKALVGQIEIIENQTDSPDHVFGIHRNPDGLLYFTNQGQPSGLMDTETTFSRTLNSMVRVHTAEKARGWVFVHAGVVGWKGKAIVLPAMSYGGKTTLVSELLKLGAVYFSDEYAVFDEKGKVHPFARDLSVRVDGSFIPVQRNFEEFGTTVAAGPAEVGMVVLTRFENGSIWTPETLGVGPGILETVPTVLPINSRPEFALKVLYTAFRRAIILRSPRGEARDAAESILSLLESDP